MDVLFWSGGKDAYLALEFYRREYPDRSLSLLTTYDKSSGMVPHQRIPIDTIKEQAKKLGMELHLVPLPKNCPNDVYLDAIEKKLDGTGEQIESLVFGDWKLEDIRKWREEEFRKLGYQCLFPIWEKSLQDLLPILTLKPVEVTISAVEDRYRKYIRVGESYNQQFVRQLPAQIDPMGENGEFHTKVTIQTFDDMEPEKQPLY